MKEIKQLKKGTKLLDLIEPGKEKEYIYARLDGHLVPLDMVLDKDSESEVEFLSLDEPDATRIYVSSLRFLVSVAVKSLLPKCDCRFFYNISRSFFVRVMIGKKTFPVNQRLLDSILSRMEDIVRQDIQIVRKKVSKEEAIGIYHELGYQDKIQVLKYRKEEEVHLYSMTYQGKVYSDYLYDKMVLSSGYLTSYRLFVYAPGMMLQVPRTEFKGEIPPFKDETKFASALSSGSKWLEENSLDTVVSINRFIKNYGSMALVNVCETRFNNMLADLGKTIIESPDPIRCICIAGPSSSGKTSFSNRLMFELMSRGLRPIRISMDDFYMTKEEMGENVDIESVDAINIEMFNEQINALVMGESVSLPSFDFKTHSRSYRKPLSVGEKQPLIIEGIHALNDRLITQIPHGQKFRIFISPQPQVNLDNHTPLSMTYMRLIRRIARDSRTRGSDADETIDMWANVRKGEFKYIYPNQENADFVFDSFQAYEICALRNLVLPLLDQIKPEDRNYALSQRLKQMVRYFLPIPTYDIPCNSVLREFIGGSSFKDAR